MQWRNRKNSQHYLRRANQFLNAAELLQDDLDGFGDVVAVAAVHGGIALADAILEGFGEGRSKDQDHQTAVPALRTLCKRQRTAADGIRHLESLLKQKNHFSYGEQRLEAGEIRSAVVHLKRLASWAYRNFPLADEDTEHAES